MKKNREKTVELDFEIRKLGNWNYKNDALPIYTKPIAEIIIDGDRFVFKHEEILKLIKIYNDVDVESIEMIKSGMAGEIKVFEKPLLQKIKEMFGI